MFTRIGFPVIMVQREYENSKVFLSQVRQYIEYLITNKW